MKTNQIILIVSLILTILSWVKGKPSKTVSSAFLLVIFLIFGHTPVEKVLFFPLSSNFLVIVLSFVFSQGIINSKLAEKLFEPLIVKYSDHLFEYLAFMAFSLVVLSLTIPQPFSRFILLAMVYQRFFRQLHLDEKLIELLLFGMFSASMVINTFFKEGDIILNRGLLSISGMELSSLEWIKIMLVPGIGLLLLVLSSYALVFRKELSAFRLPPHENKGIELNKEDRINLFLILATVLLWASEGFHGIKGTYIVSLSIALMALRGLVTLKDFKTINVDLLMFLTAAFSIGNVMTGSGIAGNIFGKLAQAMPGEFSLKYILVVSLSTMALHTVLGSSVTTLSVAIPSFMSILLRGVEPTPILFIIFVSTVFQFTLPIHNALLAVGLGNKFYDSRPILRFGLVCTLNALLALFFLYLPWWRFIGLLAY